MTPADFLDAVADADHSGLAGSIEIAAALLVNDPAAFASHCDWILSPEIARKKWRRARGSAHTSRL